MNAFKHIVSIIVSVVMLVTLGAATIETQGTVLIDTLDTGWYGVEHDPIHGTFRWSATSAIIQIPSTSRGLDSVELTLELTPLQTITTPVTLTITNQTTTLTVSVRPEEWQRLLIFFPLDPMESSSFNIETTYLQQPSLNTQRPQGMGIALRAATWNGTVSPSFVIVSGIYWLFLISCIYGITHYFFTPLHIWIWLLIVGAITVGVWAGGWSILNLEYDTLVVSGCIYGGVFWLSTKEQNLRT